MFFAAAEHRAEVGRLLHQRKVFGLQGLQRELALATLEDHLVLAGLERDGLVPGHGAQDVDQFARTNGGGEVARIAAEFGGGADLDFQVAGGELDRGADFAQQHVGEDGQRVPPLHDAGNGLQNR